MVVMSKIILKFLWSDKTIGVCLDQKIGPDSLNPLTEYFFWPQRDAWEDIKNFIEKSSWIDQREAIILLNRLTDVINFWQDNSNMENKGISFLNSKFPDCFFILRN